MPWFHYSQNNSGGMFTGPTHVVIEADDADHADMRAVSETPIYFDGCDEGVDCPCCGDRWSRAWGDGDFKPMVYDQPAAKYVPGTLSSWHDSDVVVVPKKELPRTIEHKSV